eukprot:2417022-Rhodomonas_salina.1
MERSLRRGSLCVLRSRRQCERAATPSLASVSARGKRRPRKRGHGGRTLRGGGVSGMVSGTRSGVVTALGVQKRRRRGGAQLRLSATRYQGADWYQWGSQCININSRYPGTWES